MTMYLCLLHKNTLNCKKKKRLVGTQTVLVLVALQLFVLKKLVEFPCKTVWDRLFFKRVDKFLRAFSIISSMLICLFITSFSSEVSFDKFFFPNKSIGFF